jgi:hypothetical protein
LVNSWEHVTFDKRPSRVKGAVCGPPERRPAIRRTGNVAQITVVSLLVWAAYWAALPWIDCLRAFPAAVPIGDSFRYCTLGVPFFPTIHGWNLLAGALYSGAAVWVLIRRP